MLYFLGSGPGVAFSKAPRSDENTRRARQTLREVPRLDFYWAEIRVNKVSDGRLIAFRAVEGYPFLVCASLPHQRKKQIKNIPILSIM